MICSALSRTWQLKLGLTVRYRGTTSPKTLSARLLEWYVFLHFKTLLLSKNFILQAREYHNYFKKFPHGWAIEEFLKSNLKNKHSYAHKQGYLGDWTNQGVESGEGSKLGDGDEGASDKGSDGAGSNQGGDNRAGDDSESEGCNNDDVDQGSDDRASNDSELKGGNNDDINQGSNNRDSEDEPEDDMYMSDE